MFGTHSDITARKEAEDEVRNTVARLTLATRAGGVGVWDYDIVSNTLVWDEQMYRLYGIGAESFRGAYDAWRVCLHPDDRARGDEEIQKAIRGEKEFDIEFRVVWPDGTVHTIRGLALVHRDDDGRPLHMIGTNWDITRQKQSEALCRVSSQKWEAIISSSPDGIGVVALDGTLQIISDNLAAMYGYSIEEKIGLIGRKMLDFIDPQYHSLALKHIEEILAGKNDGHITEYQGIKKDGGLFYVEVKSSALLGPDGKPSGILFVQRDVTERKKVENALLETNRSLILATNRATEMAAQAEMSSLAKSEFLANMSHEIRTPMNGIIGMTGLLLDTKLTNEQRHFAESVKSSGEALLFLLNDILDFSKIEANMLELETLDFELSGLLADFSALMAVGARQKGLELRCSIDPVVPTLLRGDPGRLRQILTNLTGNAIKFTRSGEVAIGVSLLEARENDVLLRFSVRDTGIGIPEEKVPLLFNKFTQIDASNSRKFGGTGLGLAISKQLAGLMGGETGVKSMEHKGSEFWFTARFGTQRTQTEARLAADLHSVRVLVVDNNAVNCEIMVNRMVSWGMRPIEVSDGPAALAAIYKSLDENDLFRIVVTDMKMPGMDGEALCRVIRADRRLQDIRLVLLTSLGMRGDARRYRDMGFTAYAVKPIQHLELKAILSLSLGEWTAPGTSPVLITRHLGRESVNPQVRTKARILLAEDNVTNQQVALGILNKLGLYADAVANGEEVIKALASIPYDLVLMDVQMPEMDGITATEQIRDPRSKVRNHAIPIIAMTARTMKGDRERFLQAGMNDYVSKPVNLHTLVETLNRWLPGKEAGSSDGEEPSSKAVAGEKPGDPAVFDYNALMERIMGDAALGAKVVATFIENTPVEIGALRAAVKGRNRKRAEIAAHTIAGSSGNIGALRLSAYAADVEHAAIAGNFALMEELLPGLETQFNETSAVIRGRIRSGDIDEGTAIA